MRVCLCVREREKWGEREKEKKKEEEEEEEEEEGKEEEESERSQNLPWDVALWPFLAWRQSQIQRTDSFCKWNLEDKYFSFFSFKNLTLPLLLYTLSLLILKLVFISFHGNLILDNLAFLKKKKKK